MTWLSYGEYVKSSKVHLSTIIKHSSMVQRLLTIMPTLSYKQTDLKGAMSLCKEETSEDWPVKLKEHEIQEWDEVMARRLHVILRHVAQARLQKRSWALQLNKEAKQEATAQNSGDEATDPVDDNKEAAPLFEDGLQDESESEGRWASAAAWHGYAPDNGAAWKEVPGEVREFSVDFRIPQNAKGSDPIEVMFRGGDLQQVQALSVADFLEMQKNRSDAKATTGHNKCVYWTGTTSEGDELRLHIRADRERLTALTNWRTKALICMVKSSLFESQEAAYEFMKPIAELFAQGRLLSKKACYDYRNTELKRLNIIKGEVVVKRPAARTDPEAELGAQTSATEPPAKKKRRVKRNAKTTPTSQELPPEVAAGEPEPGPDSEAAAGEPEPGPDYDPEGDNDDADSTSIDNDFFRDAGMPFDLMLDGATT